MITFLDYFLLKIYKFIFYLRKDENIAKSAAHLYTSFYILQIIISLLSLLGILYNNKVSQLVLYNDTSLYWMILWIICPIILKIRYYRLVKISSIEESYNMLEERKLKIFNFLIFFMLIAVPIIFMYLIVAY